MVDFRIRWQSVFWRISGSGEQVLWSRLWTWTRPWTGWHWDWQAWEKPLGCGCDSIQSAARETVPSCLSPHSCADVDTLKATVTRDNFLTVLVMRSSTKSAPALSPSLFLLCYASTWDPSCKYSGLVWMEEGASDLLKTQTSASTNCCSP